jgi:threonine dehydrogenase-like Zn-dependent dehydrogenase
MKQLIITGPRTAVFEEVPIPACPTDGIVVRAKLTAISTGTELRVFRAIPVDKEGRYLHERIPFVLPAENGYSMLGEVVEAGTDATGVAVGDRVFVPAPHKQYAAVSARLAIKIPAAISDEQAVFLNILEVGHIALRRGSPAIGENVAIIGQGVIGLSVLAYCQAFGFRTVVVDENPTRLSIAQRIGSDLAVSASEVGFVDRIVEFSDGQGADLVLEAASRWAAVETAMAIARPGGRVVVVSRHTDVPQFNPVGHPYLGKRLSLLTSYGHEPDGQRWDRVRSFALTLQLLSRQRLAIQPMITHRFDWSRIPEVYGQLDQGDRGMVGIVINWS